MAAGIRLGITGGMGSGKSTASAALSRMGAFVVDADACARQVTDIGGSAIPSIVRRFGDTLVLPSGALNRVRMRELVFSDRQARAALESIIHPLVQAAIEQAVGAPDALSARCIVYDIPLLAESVYWRQRLDTVLVVDCTESVQIQRVGARNQLTPEQVRNILNAQATRPERLKAADHVLLNDGISLHEFQLLVQEFGRQLGL